INSWKESIPSNRLYRFEDLFVDLVFDFAELAADSRRSCRSVFHELGLRAGTPSRREFLAALPPDDLTGKAGRHLYSMLMTTREMPNLWQRIVGEHLDYYVFQIHGDPFPTMPGEHVAMVRRMRSWPSRASAFRDSLVQRLIKY